MLKNKIQNSSFIKWSCTVIEVFVFTASVTVGNAYASDLNDLLESIAENQSTLSTAWYELEKTTQPSESITLNAETFKSQTLSYLEIIRSQTVSDGIRLMRKTTTNYNEAILEKPLDAYKYELWNGEIKYDYTAPSDPKFGQGRVAIIENLDEGYVRFGGINGLPSAFWMGTLYRDKKSLIEILKSNIDKIQYNDTLREEINGISCRKLILDSEYGHRTLWFADLKNTPLVKAVVKYDHGDYFNGIVIEDNRSYEMIQESLGLIEVNGIYIPSSVKEFHNQYDATGNKIYSSTCETKCLDIVLNPDYEAEGYFVPDIPDGVDASIIGFQYMGDISHRWDAKSRQVIPIQSDENKKVSDPIDIKVNSSPNRMISLSSEDLIKAPRNIDATIQDSSATTEDEQPKAEIPADTSAEEFNESLF